MTAGSCEPFTVAGVAGPLIAVRFVPAKHGEVKGCLVVAPPFAEELNKCRHVLARLGRSLAAQGWQTVIVDAHGTGDSSGDFADARWEIWCADLATAVRAARGDGTRPVALCGVRLGALMALEALRSQACQCDRLVLWQPVLSGRQALTQFLRLQLAGAVRGGARTESVESLRGRLNAGETLEIAGYALAPALAAALDSLSTPELVAGTSTPVAWYEISSNTGAPLAAAARSAIDAWTGRSVPVQRREIAGPPFWATTELSSCDALIDATVRDLLAPA